MELNALVENAQLFLLIFARVMALFTASPLLNSSTIPPSARVGLAIFAGMLVYPDLVGAYPIAEAGLQYLLMILGEVLVGIIIGLLINLVHTAFLLAGEFFSVQTGFSASQVFDPMAQIQLPIMGQFLNIIAMFIFVTVSGFNRIFLTGIKHSFQAFRPIDLILGRESMVKTIFTGFTNLFTNALVLALPIMGTLLLVSISLGLLAKAAPQMNLLMLGFPINISVGFLMIFISLPFIVQVISQIIDHGFVFVESFMLAAGGKP